MEKDLTIALELAMESRFGYVPWSRESGRQRPEASIYLLTIVSNTNIENKSHSPLRKYDMARGLGSCSTRVLASLRTRVAGASLPSSRRASRKVSGKMTSARLSSIKNQFFTPQKWTTQAQRRGQERKIKDYDLCNAGKPINGGICE
jgi:hypothetical protein